jgi:hypothetical protein
MPGTLLPATARPFAFSQASALRIILTSGLPDALNFCRLFFDSSDINSIASSDINSIAMWVPYPRRILARVGVLTFSIATGAP